MHDSVKSSDESGMQLASERASRELLSEKMTEGESGSNSSQESVDPQNVTNSQGGDDSQSMDDSREIASISLDDTKDNSRETVSQPLGRVPSLWLRLGVWMLRVLIGGVFVVSGFVKAVDIWGFLFKLEEYLAVWHMSQPRSVVLTLAIFVAGYEFVLGALTLMGCYKRTAPWGLLLSMIVMLPLTLYLWIANPVADCGCFGDFIIISNAVTFWKNVAITIGLILLLIYSPRLKESLFNPAIQWMVATLAVAYILCVALYGYNAQPVIDFRPYAVGTQLSPSIDDDDDADDGDYLFVYEKDGVTENFDIDNLPDSTWTFVDRVENSDAAVSRENNQLTVFDEFGDDVTAEAFAPDSLRYIAVIPEPRRADLAFTYSLNEIFDEAQTLGIPMVALLGTDSSGVKRWQDMSMAEYPCYSADETQLKELARGSISFVVLENGVVVSKTTLNSMNPEVVENPGDSELFRSELLGYGSYWFRFCNGIFAALLLVIYLFQGIILTIRAKIRRAYRKKHEVV